MPKPQNEDETNRHVAWMHHTAFRFIYVFVVVACWITFRLFFTKSLGVCTTATIVAHAIVSGYLLHWKRGIAEGGLESDSVAHLTFWEQVDDGTFGTPTRRFLSAVPVLMFFVAVWANGEDLFALCINGIVTLLLVIAKHPGLFNVRIFGINKLE